VKISCSKCGNDSQFRLPLWVRATFRFNEDGTISLLHTTPLESLEEKLTNQRLVGSLKCSLCGAAADVDFNPDETKSQRETLEAL